MGESTPLTKERIPEAAQPRPNVRPVRPAERRGWELLRGLLTLAYPLVVYAGLAFLTPRQLAIGLSAVFALRAATRWRRATASDLGRLAPPALLLASVALAAALYDDPRFLLLVPAIMNGALLFAFGRTLFGGGPSLVETLARLQDGDLGAAEAAHCRRVTRVWCGFFLANGGVSLLLALRGDLAAWTLYTGVIAYLLMGILFAAELVVRARRFGRYEGTLVEPLFRRWFPKGPAA
jgi:uncharacterized membrane protein